MSENSRDAEQASYPLRNSLETLAHPSAASLRRFFVVAVTLDVFCQTFLFAHLLEALDHLLDRLVAFCLDLDHTALTFPFRSNTSLASKN